MKNEQTQKKKKKEKDFADPTPESPKTPKSTHEEIMSSTQSTPKKRRRNMTPFQAAALNRAFAANPKPQ